MSSNLFQAWLDRVCAMLPGVRAAVFVLAGKDRALCAWPAGREADEALVVAARLTATRGAPVDSPHEGGAGDAVLAHPIRIGDRLFGGVALSLAAGAGQHAVVHQLIDWSESWLELLLRKRAAAPSAGDEAFVDLLDTLPATEGVETLGAAVVSWLDGAVAAERIWFGHADVGTPAVVASSLPAGDPQRAALAGMVEEAMLECVVRGITLRFDAATSQDAELAACHVLAREGGCEQLLVVPVPLGDDRAAVLLLERGGRRGGQRGGQRAFGIGEARQVEQLGRQLRPFLRLHSALRPGPLGRLERSGAALLERLAVPGITWVRGTLAVGLLVALVLAFAEGRHEVRAEAFIEGRVQQAISAPFEGFVAEAPVRAGETVVAGQTLARLDDEELRLERQRIAGELAALDREYRQALAAVDQAQTRILQARIQQAAAQRELLDGRLALVELQAPVDGVVISGDLSRSVGRPVARGELLFEIAPLDAYRVVARVREADVDELREGQTGSLVLSAFPGERIPFSVERISSVLDEATELGVVFRVEGTIDGEAARLRPGMAGVARIDAGSRSLWWIYTHELGDWLRLLAWRWLP